MAKLNSTMKQILGGKEAKLEVNLDAMFDTLVPDSTSFRQAVGQAIIDKIRDRCDNNEYLNKAKQTYSKSYEESIEFKAHGKKKDDVNMKLTGDMLGLLDVVDEKKNKITLGWQDNADAAKAYNHVTGDTVPKRNFLGLPQSDIDEIADQFRDQIPDVKGDNATSSSVDLFNQFVNSNPDTNIRTLGQIIKGFSSGEE